LFFRQWDALKRHAGAHGVKLIGDAPIFVSPDSADVWARPELYLLDRDRRPTEVAGVPPDYFSADGQLWGNPLYDWAAHRRDRYGWWTERLRAAGRQADLVRLDHFRALAAAWHVPAGAPTARTGRWVPGPADDFLISIREQLGGLPLIAEDLGLITPDVLALRERFGLPGMRVLQFAFGSGPDNLYLPHNFDPTTVVYTGTHDNDTSRGWYAAAPEHERDFFRRYTGRSGDDVAWDLIRLAWASVADHAVVPLQDLLDLPSEARMNRPGVGNGNWTWRLRPDQPLRAALDRLADLTALYSRLPAKPSLTG
jgi:4-alpha-glucanotransferase